MSSRQARIPMRGAAVIAGALFLCGLFHQSISAATIHWNHVRQRFDGIGASPYANLHPDEVIANADLLFSTEGSGWGLSLCRIGFPWDPDTGGRPYRDPEIAKLAQDRGATVWASVFSPPAEWKSNGNRKNGGYLLAAHYQDFATLLADSILELKSKHGIDLYAVSIQNEPTSSNPWASCIWTGAQFHTFVPMLAATLSQKGLTTKIMLGETGAWRFEVVDPTMQDPETAKHIDIIAAHVYGMPFGWASPYAGIRPVWQTEHRMGDDDDFSMGTGMSHALEIHNFMTLSEANAWHSWNLYPLLNAKRGYCMGQFSKFVRPGYFRIGVTDEPSKIRISAYKDIATGKFAVVAINKDTVAKTVSFDLNGFDASSVTPWITSETLSLAQQSSVAVSGSFSYTLPARSVTTFAGTATGSPNQAPVIDSAPWAHPNPAKLP